MQMGIKFVVVDVVAVEDSVSGDDVHNVGCS